MARIKSLKLSFWVLMIPASCTSKNIRVMNQRKEMESKSHNPTHQEKSALRLMEKTCTTQGVRKSIIIEINQHFVPPEKCRVFQSTKSRYVLLKVTHL